MNRPGDRRSIEVLLVEDNEGDIRLIREALQSSFYGLKLHVVTNGLRAMEFLRSGKPKPNLVILDLNIPGKNGYDVLAEIKGDPELGETPVVIFTSSLASRDVSKAYRLHANSFVRKPSDVDEFFAAVTSIEQYWTQTATLPIE